MGDDEEKTVRPEYKGFHQEKIAELEEIDGRISSLLEHSRSGYRGSDALLERLMGLRKSIFKTPWRPKPPPVIRKSPPPRRRSPPVYRRIPVTKPYIPPPKPRTPSVSSEEDISQLEALDDQILNNAGGYSFQVCDMVKLKRFIVLGSETGSYYSIPKDMAMSNILALDRLINDGHGTQVIDMLRSYSAMGRCAKDDIIIICLMQCAMCEKEDVSKAAYDAVPVICNIPTKLFLFLDMCQIKINRARQLNPPTPQPDKKRRALHASMNDLNLADSDSQQSEAAGADKVVGEKRKLISDDVVESEELQSKKKKKKKKKKTVKPRKPKDVKEPGFKKVNKLPKKSSGWGRMRRTGISSWYTDPEKNHDRLLYLLTKYKQRHGWSHKQVMGYAHPKVKESDELKMEKDIILTYCTRGYEKANIKIAKERERCRNGELPVRQSFWQMVQNINMVEEVSKLSKDREGDEERLLTILTDLAGQRELRFQNTAPISTVGSTMDDTQIAKATDGGNRAPFQIVREHIPTQFLKSVKVWEAMLRDMPMTAMIRNLGKMSNMGMFARDESENVQYVVDALTNVTRLKKARVHPMKILIAMKVYEQGHGEKSDLQWTVSQPIVKALNTSFHLSFQSEDVKKNFKTGKKFMLNLDVSVSMTFRGCVGCELITPAMASVAMALITWNIEDDCKVMSFGGRLESMEKILRKDMTLTEAMKVTEDLNFGTTDCALPMVYATDNKIDVDIFIIYTDSETWYGSVHPPVALKRYNKQVKKANGKADAKVIVCGLEADSFSVADPDDPNMMDMVGFDVSAPDIIAEFAKGEIAEPCSVCDSCTENSRHVNMEVT